MPKKSLETIEREAAEKKRFLAMYKEVHEKYGTETAILEKIKEHYPHIDKKVFGLTCRSGIPNLNTYIVIAFCKTFGCEFGYDLYDIYLDQKGDRPVEPQRVEDNPVDPSLPDRFYGRFYGYFFNSAPNYRKSGTIDQFTLDVQTNCISLRLRHYALDMEHGNVYSPREIPLKGKIVYNPEGASPNGILTILFTSSDNKYFCVMSFNKFRLDGKLYFRRGSMLTKARGGEEVPVIQSFIFTDQKIDLNVEDNKRALQGALRLVNGTILVKEEDLKPFIDSELLKKYFETTPHENARKEYVQLDETRIMGLDIDNNELYRTLFQIKSKDFSTNLYTFSSVDPSWQYITSLCSREAAIEQEL